MNNANGRFVVMPSLLKLSDIKIKYQDALTYLSLRSFNNSSNGKCYPAYETIAARAGASRGFIIKSIERLESSKLITVEHSTKKNVSNKYSFRKVQVFDQIPYQFFNVVDLTLHEKALLLCLRQFFNQGPLQSIYSIKEFCGFLGLTYNTVSPLYLSLKSKNYISSVIKYNSEGKILSKTDTLTPKINWPYGYKKTLTDPRVKKTRLLVC